MQTETDHHEDVTTDAEVPSADATSADRNELCLRGRVSRDAELVTLPSGDELVSFNLVVRRADGSRVDTLPIAVGPAPARGARRRPGQATRRVVTRAERLLADTEVEVDGWVQRRFWRGAGGPLSAFQVVATELRVLRR